MTTTSNMGTVATLSQIFCHPGLFEIKFKILKNLTKEDELNLRLVSRSLNHQDNFHYWLGKFISQWKKEKEVLQYQLLFTDFEKSHFGPLKTLMIFSYLQEESSFQLNLLKFIHRVKSEIDFTLQGRWLRCACRHFVAKLDFMHLKSELEERGQKMDFESFADLNDESRTHFEIKDPFFPIGEFIVLWYKNLDFEIGVNM